MSGPKWKVSLRPPVSGLRDIFARASQAAWWQVSGDDLSAPVLLRLGRNDKGELVCTGLVFGLTDADAVGAMTASALRIPLAAIVSNIATRLLHDYPPGAPKKFYGLQEFPQMLGWLADQSPSVTVLRTRPGAKGYGDDHWQTVVARYRQALKDHPTAPTKALIEQYPNWSPATIRYWLTVVRKRGLLGKSPLGKPGETRRPRRKVTKG